MNDKQDALDIAIQALEYIKNIADESGYVADEALKKISVISSPSFQDEPSDGEIYAAQPIKPHVIRQVVNELRDIAIKFHGAQQLRGRIAYAIDPLIKSDNA